MMLQAARLRIPRGRLRGKPWWSDEVVTARKIRKQAFFSYRNNPTAETLQVLLAVTADT